MIRHALAALILALIASAAASARGPYDDHRLVRVELTSHDQLAALDELGAIVLNCCVGVGPLDVVLPPGALEGLRKSGIGHRIVHENVQALVDAERERIEAQGGVAGLTNVCNDAWFDEYKPLADVLDRMDDLVATYPDFVQLLDVGQTIEARTIRGMRITAPGGGDKPIVLLTATQHAREWVAPMTAMYVAKQLACGSDGDPDIQSALEQIEFIIIPVVNLDGYLYSWSDERLWRKNRRLNCPTSNDGVDLNRNWGVDWSGPESTSSDPCHDLYFGTEPFSEPETAALRDFILARSRIVAHLDFHAYTQVIIQPWGYTETLPPDQDAIDALGADMTAASFAVNGFTYPHGGGGTVIYLASGVMPDWVYGDTGAFSYTVELRPSDFGGGGFLLPADQIYPTCTENFAAVMAMAAWARQGVQFVYPEGLPDLLPADQSSVVLIDLAETYESVEPGSPRLLARVGTDGSFTSTPLTSIGAGQYEGVLPAAPCDEIVQYYVELDTTTGGTYRDPVDAPAATFEALATEIEILAGFDLETDPAWSVSGDAQDGQWERGVPVDGDRGDPPTDFDGSGSCYLTDNVSGDSDVDQGTTILTTGAFDVTGGGTLSYAYWINDIPSGQMGGADGFYVEVATDAAGANWQPLRQHLTPLDAWRTDSVVIDQSAATSTVRFRFSVADLGAGHVVEGGLDAIEVSTLECPVAPCAGDVAGNDGVVNVNDLLALLGAWGSGDPTYDIAEPANGVVDVADLLALLGGWGPCL